MKKKNNTRPSKWFFKGDEWLTRKGHKQHNKKKDANEEITHS